MKALILVGGFGTRLRPLTLSCPKPLVEFCNKPMLVHQIEALAQVGVDEVVLAVNFHPQVLFGALREMEQKYNIKITCSREREPLGTAGPMALARSILEDDGDPFFVFNSDVMCRYDLHSLLEFHTSHAGEGTLWVTRVDEPGKYGVVVSDRTGLVRQFQEKPPSFVGNIVNAGVYIFDSTILNRIQLRPMSLEKDVLPQMVAEGALFSLLLQGYWRNVGQPKDYLSGTGAHLASMARHTPPGTLAEGEQFVGHVLVHPTAVIGPNCLIGPDVIVGPECVIEEGVRLSRSVLLRGVTVRSHTWVDSSIIGWSSYIGRWCRLEGTTVVGEDVQVRDEKFINGGLILPHKTINSSISEPGTIVM